MFLELMRWTFDSFFNQENAFFYEFTQCLFVLSQLGIAFPLLSEIKIKHH